MLTQGIEVMKYVRASAGRSGISIVFEDINQPRHDGKTIYLPKISSCTSDLELKEMMASVDHEVAHDRFSSFEVLKEKEINPKGILFYLWNFLEDSRVNNIEAYEYRGFRENWDESSSILIDNIFAKASKDDSMIAKLTTSLIHWESHISASNFPKIQLASSKQTPDEEITNVLNNYSDRLINCHSILDKRLGSESTYDLAVNILKDLSEECKELVKKYKPSKEIGKETPGDATSETKSPTSPKESDENKDSPPEFSEEKGEGKAKEEEYKIYDLVLSKDDIEKYSITMPEDDADEMGKVGINFEPVKTESDAWTLTDYEKFIVVDYPNKIGDIRYFHPSPSFIKEHNNVVGDKVVAQENFAQQVRRLIQIRAKVQRQYGVKKGKLDQSRLSRICFNAPGFSERIFKNKIENKILDAAITVLVDMSGSMMGQKAHYALASTLLVNEVCSTLNIPSEIIGFTDYSSVPMMFVYKGFSDLKVNQDNIKEYFASSSRFMTGNPDGENILWAHNRLVKRQEKKKLMIVMSDGSPAASRGIDGLGEFTLQVVQEIENSKKVDIYGLGLCSSAVTYYYKSNSVVNKPEDIPSKLIELIERKLINV